VDRRGQRQSDCINRSQISILTFRPTENRRLKIRSQARGGFSAVIPYRLGQVVSPRGRVIANNPIVTGNRVEYNTTADEPSVDIESINCRWVSRFPLRHGTYLRCVCL